MCIRDRDMVDTCLCMGAGITMAQGLQRVEPDKRYFSFVGDSTFFASGLTGIVNAVYNEASLTLCILDNSTTAMTGHQPHPGTGRTMMGNVVEKVDITKVLEGIGVKNTVTVDALDLNACVDAVLKLSAMKGVKAIIFKSPCAAIIKSFRTVSYTHLEPWGQPARQVFQTILPRPTGRFQFQKITARDSL